MSDLSGHGKSYGDIVSHSFRKNRNAVIAMWISVVLLALAALAPILANDRPYFFKGTMPGQYRKSFTVITRGAYMALLSLPARFRGETKKFEDRKCTFNELLRRMTDEEAAEVYETLERLRERAEGMPEIRGRWISRDVTLAEMIEQMEPAERPPFERINARIVDRLPKDFEEQLEKNLTSFRTHFDLMIRQLAPDKRKQARDLENRFRNALSSNYLQNPGEARATLSEVRTAVREAFAPSKVTLIPTWWAPLLDSMDGTDAFFVALTVMAILAFGPLTWWKLKRLSPLGRRWKVTWLVTVVPAAVIGLFWGMSHDVKFETVTYTTGTDDGAIVMETAVWPPIPYRYDTLPDDASERLLPPSPKHLFGTDFAGRDLLARMLWGSRVSLSIGFVSAAIAVSIGIVMGVLAGFLGGWWDIAISRFLEIMICFPYFFLILAVVAFLPPNIVYVMIVLGIFGWMGISRLQRGEILRLLRLDFVSAAHALGATNLRVMFRHLLPNALAPVLVAASFAIASAMLAESALSFLGFGVQEPNTSWGQILYTGRSQVIQGFEQWWTFTIPGAAIFVAVTCYNLVGDGIRDAVDPRLKS